MLRVLLTLAGALVLGGMGAFFLFVPPALIAAVSMATVTLLLGAFIAMFWLGNPAELQPLLPVDGVSRKLLPQQDQITPAR